MRYISREQKKEEIKTNIKNKIINYSIVGQINYKPIILEESKTIHTPRGHLILYMTKVDNYIENDIYISKNLRIKRMQLYRINKRINKALDLLLLRKSKNKPTFYIIAENEMIMNAIASYNVISNVIYLTPKLGDHKDNITDYTKRFSMNGNPLSTILHELIHWKDAETYRKSIGNILQSNVREYFTYRNELAFKILEKKQINRYNVGEISRYALDSFESYNYDETLTEYKVKHILKEKRRKK